MKNELFIRRLHRRIAQISVGASALRNQGAGGIVKICRDYFENSIDLTEFKTEVESGNFDAYLNRNTNQLIKKFPENGKSWGAARKGLNLFFREVVYNFYLANFLGIPTDRQGNEKFLEHLEIPLDKDVATGLTHKFSELPRWKSIRELTLEESNAYQEYALIYARELKVPRIHLDLEFWRRKK